MKTCPNERLEQLETFLKFIGWYSVRGLAVLLIPPLTVLFLVSVVRLMLVSVGAPLMVADWVPSGPPLPLRPHGGLESAGLFGVIFGLIGAVAAASGINWKRK